ncbi:hypothetical protein RclHR1_00370015 [Rhizophagus clarus]|uniref:Kinase-like domain-containing protein n=1 Tax=Rhizophagus clarus TaxID=94130 RepID=A0A2Z6RP31_9GLOM|nr:hypothetical protein RclHR1_00370015 [Rhizophagus clarus]GET03570.1 kinase-like domain-containing protein [Rhizophagus clarus]
MALFSEEDNGLIKQYMKEFSHRRNVFALISSLMPKYTARQIYVHWNKLLNPKLCNKPLGYHEKNYISELIQKHRTSKTINWKNVIYDLERQFGKLYSQNLVKNFWYSKCRRDNSRYTNDPTLHLSKPHFDDAKYQNCSPMLSTKEPMISHEPKFNKPYKMKPL